MKRALSKRQRAVLEVMNKPKIPAEIREQTGLNKGNNLSSTLKELVHQDLIYCLNKKTRLGKLYGLTKKGARLRKKLGLADYYQPKDINWNLYGWVVCGKQRKAIIRAMVPDVPMSLRTIRERALEHNSRISRTNANDILQCYVRYKLLLKIKIINKVNFKLTRSGNYIKEQLIE